MTRRLQGRLGPIAFVAAAAAFVASGGCDALDGTNADYVAVCTDRAGNRVDDSDCQRAPDVYDNDGFDAGDAYLWYYLGTANSTASAPAIGQRVTGGAYRTPTTLRSPSTGSGSSSSKTGSSTTGGSKTTGTATVQRGGVSSSGGSITRGGFGVSSGSSSSGSSSKTGSGSTSSGSSRSGSTGSAGS